eukprot:gb/GEZN01021183.1/.p1 GENE.gb/GEZN01021183.1/~~gb/GEZN01021183.1/.p1  ORF type:complete len:167 (-),score=8.47 gb/GEZN01021183.1/:160-639(-)
MPLLCFYLYLPTFVSTIPLYSFARTWDLSWGNRETLTLGHDSSAERKEKNKERAKAYLAVLVIMNLLLMIGGVAQSAQTQKKVWILALSTALFISVVIQMIFSLVYWFLYWLGIALRKIARLKRTVGRWMQRCGQQSSDQPRAQPSQPDGAGTYSQLSS